MYVVHGLLLKKEKLFKKRPHLLLRVFGESVDPHTRGGDGFPEAEFDARPADVLAIHRPDGLDHTRYRLVLAEGIARAAAAALLYVDLDDPAVVFELVPQLLLRNVLLQIANK